MNRRSLDDGRSRLRCRLCPGVAQAIVRHFGGTSNMRICGTDPLPAASTLMSAGRSLSSASTAALRIRTVQFKSHFPVILMIPYLVSVIQVPGPPHDESAARHLTAGRRR